MMSPDTKNVEASGSWSETDQMLADADARQQAMLRGEVVGPTAQQLKAAATEAASFSERDAIVCARINVIDALTRVRRAKTNQHGRTLPKAMARRLARIEAALSDLTVEMSDALSGS